MRVFVRVSVHEVLEEWVVVCMSWFTKWNYNIALEDGSYCVHTSPLNWGRELILCCCWGGVSNVCVCGVCVCVVCVCVCTW